MKKHWHLYVLSLLIIISVFIRAYNFHDWLYFEADQARNAKNSIEAIEGGINKLPLLGPKAGGTGFHLGPISYYFEYVSGLTLGIESPEVFAFSNLMFLLLAIPLCYYFFSHFFPREISLLITSLFSFSYLVAQYSRFSWNPNSIIFWGLLFILSIYKAVFEKDKKKAGLWLLVASLSYGVISQLHTIALLGFPLVVIFFWAIYRPVKINWKYWVGAILVLLVIYSPLVVYDINTKGENIKDFVKAFSVKSEDRGFFEKINKTTGQYGKYYSLIILSVNDKEIKDIRWSGYVVIVFSIVGGIILWRKKEEKKTLYPFKGFLALVSIWFLVFLLLSYSLAFKIDQPRFWFSTFFIPYIFIAIIIKNIWTSKIGRALAVIVCVIIAVVNLSAVLNWYEGMRHQDKDGRFNRKITSTSLIQNDFIGYGKMEEAVDWMVNLSRERKNSTCFNSPSTYLASYKFIFNRNYPDFDVKRINKTIEMSSVENCDVFIIDHSGNSLKEIKDKFSRKGVEINLKKSSQFGLITVWEASF